MSKKAFKSQASSSRAVAGAFGGATDGSAFGSGFGSSPFGAVASSPLSYVYEPPDLAGISDPHIGVTFKNVQKKDSTTKAKALEDLQANVESLKGDGGGVEDAVLEAWIKVYPRTSIDSSRRVRQLAHTLQGQITLSCGKRMAKHMPTIAAPWLAGMYDNDKSVSRAANDSFTRAFSSQEKRRNVWRLYQSSILQYSKDVVAKETATTLSDERTTSPDDASAKYSRVVGAAVMVVTSLLENGPEAKLEQNHALLIGFLDEDKLWKLSNHNDSFVRRAIYRLLIIALARQKDLLNPSTISANILALGLQTNQTGSALDFAKAISTLSNQLPDVWTVHYTGSGKKSARNRLMHFLRKGSRGGPPEFWSSISSLLSSLPPLILVGETDNDVADNADNETLSYVSVLMSLREGINSKDEPRVNQTGAWNCYLDTFELMQVSLPDFVDRPQFFKNHLYPLLQQYIRPSAEKSNWTVSSLQKKSIYVRVCKLGLLENVQSFEEEWRALSAKIIEDLKTSLPEQSREYAKSQDSILLEIGRWYELQASILEIPGTPLRPILEQSVPAEVASALEVIQNRNGKPYGAAAAVEKAIQSISSIVLGNSRTRETLIGFANNAIPNLIPSPSSKYLIRLLSLLEDHGNVSQAYENCMQKLAEMPVSEARSDALQTFISSPRLAHNGLLFTLVLSNLDHALKEDDEPSWKFVMAAFTNPAAPQPLAENIMVHMIEGLSIDAIKPAGLHGLEMAVKQRESTVKDFVLSKNGSSLLAALLSLSESDDEAISRRAKGLSSLVQRLIEGDGSSGQATESMLEIITGGIDASGVGSLPVDVLVTQAQKLFEQTSPDDMADVATKLLPNLEQWSTAMEPFNAQGLNPSLATTNPLGGALSLVSASSSISTRQPIARDEDGYSSAFRMARYSAKLIASTKAFELITNNHKIVVCKNLALFLQLAGDNLSIAGCIPLWTTIDPDQEAEIIDLIAETQNLFAPWLSAEPSLSTFVRVAQGQLLDDADGSTTRSYYSGRAYTALAAETKEIPGHLVGENDVDRLKVMRESKDAFASAAYLTSAPESKELQRLCNELLADLTAFNPEADTRDGIRKLVLLSCIFYGAEQYVTEIPQQRLVFFVKHAVEQLKIIQPTSIIGGQLITVLAIILPPIKGIYGEFWADILEIIGKIGLLVNGDDTLFGVYSSLRLLSLLRKPHIQEANDDLLDAWNEKKQTIGEALLDLLIKLADTSDESHQPRRTINELLHRQLTALSTEVKVEPQNLYPVLASESTSLQQAAYELLHNRIPCLQEQISVDKALSTDYVAQLPQELLSLILTAPTMDFLASASFERTIPFSLRSYLVSWKLVFDHWQNASYKVQADYVSALQEGTYSKDLLDFTFNVLINARTKPVDASKFDIESYTPGIEESPEKESHWLLIHLYYLCLRHLPSITKTWWRDSTSRQLNLAVSTWTEKYISPLIISSELSTITNWAPSQATADQPMTIKVSHPAREIIASIPVDEQTMTIAVHLPKSYPLARAEVTSVHRVGVAEKKWNFWLINTQGVINFSSGGAGEGNALIDGLMAWRKNVTAAMKGQTECAICYSVVGGDRQLPSKKCQTCKNTFHNSCLFRWFKSSNSSSCPLCRNAFNYS